MLLAHISLVIVFVFIFSHRSVSVLKSFEENRKTNIVSSHETFSLKWIPNIWELRQAELGQVNWLHEATLEPHLK